jgi:xanthine dehydrogenase YagS FAD-binding subunit
MKYFQHYNAESVTDAVSLLQQSNGKGKLIAGGTDLIGTLKDDILPQYPEAVINIKSIPGLDFIEADGNDIVIGALTKLANIVQSSVVKENFPLLADAAESVASPEIRNMGTLGGNLCQETRCWYYRYPDSMGGRIQCFRKGKGPCPAIKGDNRYHAIFGAKKCFAVCPSDMAVALAALDAGLTIAGFDGEKNMPLMDFYKPLGCALKPNELLTSVRIPSAFRQIPQRFIKFRVRESVDFAVASVAMAVTPSAEGVCKDARIVLGGVAPTPHRAIEAEKAIIGSSLTAATAETAAQSAVMGAKPLRRNAYKVQIVKALIKRALMEIAGSF